MPTSSGRSNAPDPADDLVLAVAAVAEPGHQFAVHGRKFGRLKRWSAGQPTVAFLYQEPTLIRAESGARHLLSVGGRAEIVHRPDADAPWTPLACVHCAAPIRFQLTGWTHAHGWDGSALAAPVPVSKTAWRCPDQAKSWACPLAPVPAPPARTPQQTCRALLDYTVPVGRGGEDSYDLSGVLEPYLHDRYAALRASGRVFSTENSDQLDQYSTERAATHLHFGDVSHRATGARKIYDRMPTQQMRELLELAASSPLQP